MRIRTPTWWNELAAFRDGLVAADRLRLQQFGIGFDQTGVFALPPANSGRAQAWCDFFETTISKLGKEQRIAAIVLLGSDIRPDLEAIVALPRFAGLTEEERNLNTVTGQLARVPATEVANGFRVLQQKKATFKDVLLAQGQQRKLPWLRSERESKRKADVLTLAQPLYKSLDDHLEALSVVIINSDTDRPTSFAPVKDWTGPDVVIGGALRPGGYLVWMHDLPSEKNPAWFEGLKNCYLPSSSGSDASFESAGESMIAYWPRKGITCGPQCRRVSLLQKVTKEEAPRVRQVSDIFLHRASIRNHETISESQAIAALLRKLSSRRGSFFCPTRNADFLSVLVEAARLTRWRLLCSGRTLRRAQL
jgi:hypothetical protein